MSTPGGLNNLLLASAAGVTPPAGYSIPRSVRFNSSDSAYLSRTPASAGNRKTWTWAGWVKRSDFGSNDHTIFGTTDGSANTTTLAFVGNTNVIQFYQYTSGSYNGQNVTTAVYRDPSAWMHIVAVWDTTNVTASDRMRLYVNGDRITAFSVISDPSLNSDSRWNQNVAHQIGSVSGAFYFSGYLADVHFIDGAALDPTSFGEFDDNGIWQPIEYTGSFGTNGFHLPFDDNSTAAALGTDTSGNSNTWTVNNISVTAGAGNDSLVDSPTNGTQTDTGVGGEVVGNYCTLNPLYTGGVLVTGTSTLSNGNLVASAPSNGNDETSGTIGVSSGKWYFELTNVSGGGNTDGVGIADLAGQAEAIYRDDGNFRYDGSDVSYGASWQTSGDVIGVKIDLDNNTIGFYKNGVYQGDAKTDLPATVYHPFVYNRAGVPAASELVVNFGQRPFAYTAPSGFKALCTANLPTPTIEKGSDYFDTTLYTGNGSTQTISGLDFSPDFVWGKSRSNAYDHGLVDIVRGVSKALASNLTDVEYNSAGNYVTAFNSDGFTVGGGNAFNATSATYVAWTWDAGSSNVTNTDGSITSTVRANPSAGFSIVTYTGNGTDGATVGHGLGATPEFIVLKARGNAYNWGTWHKAIGKYDANHSYALALNLTRAADATAQYAVFYPGLNSSTVFGLGNEGTGNQNSATYVAYCFAPVDGYSSFGSYTGNGSTDGPFVFTGFRPAFLMFKRSDSTGDWIIFDNKRNTHEGNYREKVLYPNKSNAEETSANGDTILFLSNGFKLNNVTYAYWNASGGTYVWAAFAEHPFKTTRAL